MSANIAEFTNLWRGILDKVAEIDEAEAEFHALFAVASLDEDLDENVDRRWNAVSDLNDLREALVEWMLENKDQWELKAKDESNA